MQALYTILIGAALAIAYHVISTMSFNRKYKLPPLVEGGVPVFGNAMQLPPIGHEAGEVVRKWADKYGEM